MRTLHTRYALPILLANAFLASPALAATPASDATELVVTNAGCQFYTYPGYKVTKASWSGPCTAGEGIRGSGTLEFEAVRTDTSSGAQLGLRVMKLIGNFKDGWLEGQGEQILTRKDNNGKLQSITQSSGQFWHSELNGQGKSLDNHYDESGTLYATTLREGTHIHSGLNGQGTLINTKLQDSASYKTKTIRGNFTPTGATAATVTYAGTLLGGTITLENIKLDDDFAPDNGYKGVLKLPHSTWDVRVYERAKGNDLLDGGLILEQGNTTLLITRGLKKTGLNTLWLEGGLAQKFPAQGYSRTDAGAWTLSLGELDNGTIRPPTGENSMTTIEKNKDTNSQGFSLTCAPMQGNTCKVKDAWFPGYVSATTRSIYDTRSDQIKFTEVSKTGPNPYDWKPTVAILTLTDKTVITCVNPTADRCDKESKIIRRSPYQEWIGRLHLVDNTWAGVGVGRIVFGDGRWATIYKNDNGQTEAVYGCGGLASDYTCRLDSQKRIIFTED